MITIMSSSQHINKNLWNHNSALWSFVFEFDYWSQLEEYKHGCTDSFIKEIFSFLNVLRRYLSINFPSSKISSAYCYFDKSTVCNPFKKNCWFPLNSFFRFLYYFKLLYRSPEDESPNSFFNLLLEKFVLPENGLQFFSHFVNGNSQFTTYWFLKNNFKHKKVKL